jgi:hypothetical protein
MLFYLFLCSANVFLRIQCIFRRVMVILDVKILASGTEVGFKLGNPKPISEGGDAETTGPQQVAPSRTVQPKCK